MSQYEQFDDVNTYDDDQKQPFKVVATKIATEEADLLDKIAARQRTTKYDIIQNLVGAFIRTCDPGTVITSELNKLRILFEQEAHVSDRLNLADPTADVQVMEATYFLGDPAHPGMRLKHVYKPFMGEANVTENATEILDRTISELLPVLYKKLKELEVVFECNSILEVLLNLVDEKDGIDDVNEYERIFSDVRKNDFGREMADAPYRRTMNNSMDNFEAKQARLEEEWMRKHQTTLEFPE